MMTRAKVLKMEDILKNSPVRTDDSVESKGRKKKTLKVAETPIPEDNLVKNSCDTINKVEEVIKDTKNIKQNTILPVVPKGKPISGRIWKSEKKKFSSTIKTKGIRNSFEKKQALRQKLKDIKELSQSIKAARIEDEEAKKQRRRENLKRQEENRKKSEVVQVITNTKKLKNIKKKHLRTIEKRDTTVVS